MYDKISYCDMYVNVVRQPVISTALFEHGGRKTESSSAFVHVMFQECFTDNAAINVLDSVLLAHVISNH